MQLGCYAPPPLHFSAARPTRFQDEDEDTLDYTKKYIALFTQSIAMRRNFPSTMMGSIKSMSWGTLDKMARVSPSAAILKPITPNSFNNCILLALMSCVHKLPRM